VLENTLQEQLAEARDEELPIAADEICARRHGD
jgi:hypothetical protein